MKSFIEFKKSLLMLEEVTMPQLNDMGKMYLFSKPAGMGDYDFMYDSKHKISGAVVHHKDYGR